MIRFDTLPPEVVEAMMCPMHQVISPSPIAGRPGCYTGALYIGSLNAVLEQSILRENNVSHLVQVLDSPWLPKCDEFKCFSIPILDQSSADLKSYLESACEFIDKALKNGNGVLVHCQQGISRSAAVVIAYLIRNMGMSYDGAHALLKGKRACIKPNSGFIHTLRDWEAASKRPSMPRRFTT